MVWLPIQWPSACARSARRLPAGSAILSPSTKKVLRMFSRASRSSTPGVTSGSGPLSNVSVSSNISVDLRTRGAHDLGPLGVLGREKAGQFGRRDGQLFDALRFELAHHLRHLEDALAGFEQLFDDRRRC